MSMSRLTTEEKEDDEQEQEEDDEEEEEQQQWKNSKREGKDEMIQEASSMTTTQSFIGVASSSNIKCSFVHAKNKKSKQLSHSKNRYTTTNCFFKTYIDNASVVPEYENKIVGTIKGFGIPAGLP
uniref:Uncharacterized protein n=1 Tax=Solanum tuberosum TaxID=4113 RepID=M0ZPT7_SOLTU